MECEFRQVSIRELIAHGMAKLQTGPFGSQLHKHEYVDAGAGVPVIPTEGIGRGRIRADVNLPYVSVEKASELHRHCLQEGDILFARRGIQATGLSACVDSDHVGSLCGTGAILLRVNRSSIHPRFLAAFLATDAAFNWLRSHAVGAVMPNLNTEIISDLIVPFPPMQTQIDIGNFVAALDDRIDLLRQTNTTLEAIAQVLFKSWFVDFDPVHAKAEGREPEAMDPATVALFPSELEESELGLIPKGWRARSLDSVANYLNGLALQKFPAESEDEFLPVIKIVQLRAGNTTGSDRASAHLKPEYVVHDGDVLFSWSGSLEVEFWCGGNSALNQHLFKVTSDEVPKWFYYLATRLHLPEFRRVAAGKATTMGHIQRKHLAQAKVAVPPPEGFVAATKIIEPLLDRRISNSLQMRELAQLRDTLIPRLISGKLRLSEVSGLIEEAVA